MNLPKVVADLVRAQDNFDSVSYSNCFSETAEVFDEGQTYNGKTEIRDWIEKANQAYRITMKPIDYSEYEQILKAKISGTFDGSPVVLTYYFEIKDNKIQSLKII